MRLSIWLDTAKNDEFEADYEDDNTPVAPD
jgi:hypothetical protein